MTKIIVVTSGKGGVGKTTTSAAFSAGLALRGHKTAVIDFESLDEEKEEKDVKVEAKDGELVLKL